jgi:cytochrome c oxidase accessory protein FixG
MRKNRFELDPERLATTDDKGNRVYLYPEDVKGVWKTRREIVYGILIAVYLILPWIYINNKPALMVNIFTREFTFFGYSYIGFEPVLLFLLVASALFFIGFMTSVYGRIWCGWGCPQTVFIQGIFMKIDRLIEGSSRNRRALDEANWSWEKVWKKSLKWLIFIIISLHISHTFIGYFTGPRELLKMSLGSPFEHFGFFLATSITSIIILLDFGWFREQFCIIACPYGRMQSVLMDENSLVVAYDPIRGEPRGLSSDPNQKFGHCINCYHCVKVCPTGIDIRRGTQLECIACTMCIDACDEIMVKVKKPKGLIRYSSQNELERRPWKKVTFRSIFYVLVAVGLIGVFISLVTASVNLKMEFIRGSQVPFSPITRDGANIIRNHFNLKVTHQGTEQYQAIVQLADESLRDKIKIITPMKDLSIDKPEKRFILFFEFTPKVLSAGSKKIKVQLLDKKTNKLLAEKEVTLVGPLN